MEGLAADYKKIKEAGAEVIAISVDKAEESKKRVVDSLNIPFPVLSDVERKTIQAYDILDAAQNISRAAVFVLDKKGTVRWSYLNENYRVRPVNDAIITELKRID